MAAGQVLTGIGVGVGYGVISEYARLALRTAIWKALPPIFKSDMIASTLQNILSAEKDKVSGLSTKGAVDVITNFIDSTINLSWAVDESIATQMFVQMIQQSIAYAIHASHAGAIGTIANVYSGSASLSTARAQAISEGTRETDAKVRAFGEASVGLNTPSLGIEISKGANARLEEYLRRIIQDTDGLVTEWNDLLMAYYRNYSTLAHQKYTNAITMEEDVVTRAHSIIEQVGNEHLRRINEQMDTLDGAYSWYEAGLMSGDELAEIALRVELERNASELVFDEYRNAVLGSIPDALVEWDSNIKMLWDDLTAMEEEHRKLIVGIMTPIMGDVACFVSELVLLMDKAIEDVCAYRNIEPSVEIKSLDTFEHELYECLLAYTEIDPHNMLTRNGVYAVVSSVTAYWSDWDNYKARIFAGDFDITFEARVDARDGQGEINPLNLYTTILNYVRVSFHWGKIAPPVDTFDFTEVWGSGLSETHSSPLVALGQTYYFRLTRTAGVLRLRVYTDPDMTVLWWDITMAHNNTNTLNTIHIPQANWAEAFIMDLHVQRICIISG